MDPRTTTARNILMQEAVKPRTDQTRRECLEHVYCDGEYLAATNGLILVFIPADGAEKGYYDIAVSGSGKNRKATFIPVKLDAVFPNWKCVVPHDVEIAAETLFDAGSDNLSYEIFRLQFKLATMKSGYLMSQKYVGLLLKTKLRYRARIARNGIVRLEAGDLTVVVMPSPLKEGTPGGIPEMIQEYKDSVIRVWKAEQEIAE